MVWKHGYSAGKKKSENLKEYKQKVKQDLSALNSNIMYRFVNENKCICTRTVGRNKCSTKF